MDSTNYILRFTIVMTIVSSLALAGMFYATKPAADKNEVAFNKRAILSAVGTHLDKPLDQMNDQEVLDVFAKQMEQLVLNMKGEVQEGMLAEKVDLAQEKKKPEADRLLPLYIFTAKDGKKYYLLSMRGNGLWDEIWGTLALEEDLNTVAGASFDHKGETPGLGAEIKDNPTFPAQFINKRVYTDAGEFVSVIVRKGGAVNKTSEVDAISGATITSDGVTRMIKKGLENYMPYLDKLKAESTSTSMK
ncbi:MAG: NADH:ubiquinone reductase (Na(+)-transporting) subunit C [Saprospiraceae bacterium]